VSYVGVKRISLIIEKTRGGYIQQQIVEKETYPNRRTKEEDGEDCIVRSYVIS